MVAEEDGIQQWLLAMITEWAFHCWGAGGFAWVAVVGNRL